MKQRRVERIERRRPLIEINLMLMSDARMKPTMAHPGTTRRFLGRAWWPRRK